MGSSTHKSKVKVSSTRIMLIIQTGELSIDNINYRKTRNGDILSNDDQQAEIKGVHLL